MSFIIRKVFASVNNNRIPFINITQSDVLSKNNIDRHLKYNKKCFEYREELQKISSDVVPLVFDLEKKSKYIDIVKDDLVLIRFQGKKSNEMYSHIIDVSEIFPKTFNKIGDSFIIF